MLFDSNASGGVGERPKEDEFEVETDADWKERDEGVTNARRRAVKS